MSLENQPDSTREYHSNTTHDTREDFGSSMFGSDFGSDMLESELQESNSQEVSGASIIDLSRAVLHEMKNKLEILNGLLSSIPRQKNPEDNIPLGKAQSLCQQISGESTQILILYRAEVSGRIFLNSVDLYSPEAFVVELAQTAKDLSNGQFKITATKTDEVPPDIQWCFDWTHLNLAVMNAVHNCLRYAKKEITFSLGIEDDMLKISVIDDSGGYPPHILNTNVGSVKNFKSSSGLGLGLRFANFIASSHTKDKKSGFVRVKNDGNRAVFEILIP